jgi:hypothetical protein
MTPNELPQVVGYTVPVPEDRIIKAFTDAGMIVQSGATYSVRGQIAQLLNGVAALSTLTAQGREAVAWDDDAAWALVKRVEAAGAERDSDDNGTWWTLRIEHFNALTTPPAPSSSAVEGLVSDWMRQADYARGCSAQRKRDGKDHDWFDACADTFTVAANKLKEALASTAASGGLEYRNLPDGTIEVRSSPAMPEGFVMVPRVPTPEMIEAAERREDDEPLSDWGKVVSAPHAEIYKAMIAAAGAGDGNGS